ncbi:MAG: hypothetical protein IPM82_24610 [Saprospiraceae bacterium]|nr:hypothetical protein [Saprospiraceae bacterium]
MQEALFTAGNISDSTFLNIVSTASGLKEFAWAKQFILDYEKYLPEEVRTETTTLSFVYLYFHQKEYVQVVELLLNFSFQNFNKLLSSKNILLRCYFELFLKNDSSYYTVFTSFAKAFDKFVKGKEFIFS